MISAMTALRNYPMISKWLRPWLDQVEQLGRPDDYRVILSELGELQAGVATEEHDRNLSRLDHDLCLASKVCSNLESLVKEKSRLGTDLDEANRIILDKLAEIHAVVGLHRLGFDKIQFKGTPDFMALLNRRIFLVEVTRLGASKGKRSDVWDAEAGSVESGVYLGFSHGPGGKSDDRLSDAIYRETEGKCQQLRRSGEQSTGWIVWISLGRDYLGPGPYELPNVGLLALMRTPKRALEDAMVHIREVGLYEELSYVVLSLGRDLDDLISPELKRNG